MSDFLSSSQGSAINVDADRPSLVLRTGITLYPDHERALDTLLEQLVERCPAPFALMADSSGQLISYKGERGKHDLIALASLVAGDLAASQEIARLTGELQASHLILREGPKYNSFIADAGENLILFVQTARETPLGWARLLIQYTGRQAVNIIKTVPAQVEEINLEINKDNLSDLIGDALDDLWIG